ncbi:hypothetical protein JL09_g6236 [Pichia kudriavzevii]|uniref:Uncharacterized protein n=1 Tax=Pichia kudriavzevii TaxID=4909 RepID=A0A099NRT7_PICKU|nr:hypothetical protein JL09_g6237 [Pichia kudriavzevii]KGK34616.1 hypothetical protein JL09_g6236 [Pichia kudriavzevii]
MSQIGNGRHS